MCLESFFVVSSERRRRKCSAGERVKSRFHFPPISLPLKIFRKGKITVSACFLWMEFLGEIDARICFHGGKTSVCKKEQQPPPLNYLNRIERDGPRSDNRQKSETKTELPHCTQNKATTRPLEFLCNLDFFSMFT